MASHSTETHMLDDNAAESVPLTDTNSCQPANNDGDKEAKAAARRNKLRMYRHIAAIIFIDIGMPIAIYYIFRLFTTQLIALIVSGIPPLLRIIYILFKYRRFDFLNGIFVLAFGLSAALSAVNGDVRVALLREAIVTGVIGCSFLATLIPIRFRQFTMYPMTHSVGRRFIEALPPQVWVDANDIRHEMSKAEWMWKYVRVYRIQAYVLTALWGFFLLVDFGVRVALIYTGVSADDVVLYGTIMIVAISVVLGNAGIAVSIFVRKRSIQKSEEWLKINDYSQDDKSSPVRRATNVPTTV